MANPHRTPLRCTSTAKMTAKFVLAFLALSPVTAYNGLGLASHNQISLGPLDPLDPAIPPSQSEPLQPEEQTFTLRHVFHHGTNRNSRLHRRMDIAHTENHVFLAAEDGYERMNLSPLKLKAQPLTIERLVDRRPSVVDPMVATLRRYPHVSYFDPPAWTVDDTLGPDVSEKETVLNLALIAANAYVEEEDEADWEDVGAPFNRTLDFGWQSDGLRGHVWADSKNETIVIGLKGTSPAVFDGDGTTTNDKVNDNLFFSCCCAQQGQWSWHKVCDCATGTYSCNNTCVSRALREENRYYAAARELYSNITEIYPNSQVWLTGHSLGGAVSSLLALTYGVPAVTFQAVPEALAAGRLGLPVPPGADPNVPQERSNTGVFHFGHTADPIYIGSCNGAAATCSYAGYALETACHTGVECVYDVVADKGWRVGVGTHKIRSVIHDVIMKYDSVPVCRGTPECRDCVNWKMYESNGTETTTSASSTSTKTTKTRTATCKTPGWWGCLDESTTATTNTKATTTATTTPTSTTATTTCETPGWFGCKDKTTTTEVTSTSPIRTSVPPTPTPTLPSSSTTAPPSTTTPTTSPTATCETPGWFGCKDETSSQTSSTTCATPGWLGCYDQTTTTMPSTTCSTQGWFGCKDQTITERPSTTCESPGLFWGCRDEATATRKPAYAL